MKKILLFAFASFLLFGVIAFAEETTTDTATVTTTDATTTTAVTTTATTTTNTDLAACVTTALDKREIALKGAMDTYYASWTSAFTARTTAFKDAVMKTTKKEVKIALDAGWKTYKAAIQTAKKVKKTSIQTAWTTYRTDVKACKGKGEVVNYLMQEKGTSDLAE